MPSFIMLYFLSVSLSAFTPHIEEFQHVPSLVQKYHLEDLGEIHCPTARSNRLEETLELLPKQEGRNYYIMGTNNRDTIAGLCEESKVSSPFIWTRETGLEVMHNYRSQLFPIGWMEFTDILITSNDCVYGNYWLKHAALDDPSKGDILHYGFVWNPHQSTIERLELEGMRLRAINEEHILVGSWQGHAALCEHDRRPQLLESLMSREDVQDWELLEATGISGYGDIVGSGMYQGKMHRFLAVPL